MNTMVRPAPVRKSVTVEVPVSRAFEVFTAGMGRWWPSTHSIGSSPLTTVTIEPRAGGRWYESGQDGSECQWGDVLAWEPPSRVLLAWRLGIDWRYDPELLTEVDIRFTAIGDNATRVDLEHRLLGNMGERAAQAREMFEAENGWAGLLSAYRASAGP